MEIIKKPITVSQLIKLAKQRFGNMIKVVVDIDRKIMAIDGELHADEEALLIENGSKQNNLWGINIYPELKEKDFIEFDSMINLKPSTGNMTRGVDDPKIRKKIAKLIGELIQR